MAEKQDRLVEEVTILSRSVRLTHTDIPLDAVDLDDDNPRIRYRWQQAQGGKSRDEVILSMNEVKDLRRDIEKTGGLRERIIVQENGREGHWKVVEGNCRLACYRDLHAKRPSDSRWQKIPARILPKDVQPKEIAILLTDFHVAGKIKWNAHEKAGQVYSMSENFGMKYEEIALYMRTSKSTVTRFVQAYKLMMETFLKIDHGKFRSKGEGTWSYFDEFFKRKELRDELKHNPQFGEEFCRWVGDGRLQQPVNVRRLPAIIASPEARKKLEGGSTFADAQKIVEAKNPEEGSDFFRLLARLRDACTSEAQIGEIIRIRADKVAQEKVQDTYKALVQFMRLADLKPKKV
jgi:hypothetical protein